MAMQLLTYDANGIRETVEVGDLVSACVKRKGRRQMFWYAARVIAFDGDRAVVELTKHPGEKALLGPMNLARRYASA